MRLPREPRRHLRQRGRLRKLQPCPTTYRERRTDSLHCTRIDPDRQKELIAVWLDQTPPLKAAPGGDPGAVAEVAMEDFARIDLRSAKVLAAGAVPKTEKLLKLTLDLGSEQRTVISGIAGAYAPADLVGRTVLYLANLKPAKIRGVISQGMILAAGGDVLSLCSFDREAPPGTMVK